MKRVEEIWAKLFDAISNMGICVISNHIAIASDALMLLRRLLISNIAVADCNLKQLQMLIPSLLITSIALF